MHARVTTRPHITLPTRSLLHEAGVPFVAGWRSIVADAAAPFFARGFLAALQGGKDYAEAYELGKLEVESQTEGPDPSLRILKTAINGHVGRVATQRFQLVDPKSALVVQKAEVNAPHWRPACHGTLHLKWAHRVRQGQLGEGRLAAGVPDHRENTPPPPFGVPMLPPKHLPRPAAVDAVVRRAAVEALGKLEAAVLAQYAPALVAKLEHSNRRVRQSAVEALGKLEAAVLAQYAPALVAELENRKAGVRLAVVQALGKLEAAVLAQHAPAIVAKLNSEPNVDVRRAAKELLGWQWASTW